MTRKTGICLCLAEGSLDADRRIAEEWRRRIDLVELRADYLTPAELARAAAFPRMVDLPVILTLRRPAEGGRFAGDERERVRFLSSLCATGYAWIDLEEDLDAPGLVGRATAAGARIVRSLHDFDGVPSDLPERLRRLCRHGEVPKAAVTPRSSADLARFLSAVSVLPPERVFLGMGEIGQPTRILAPKLGSLWCYASAPGVAVAPGQLDPGTLEETYRFRRTGRSTAVFGVIGNPVVHSRSPLIHNRGFEALGIDAVYLPFTVPDLDGFRAVADALAIRGLSVTVPYKQAVISWLSRRDDLVERIGACNTVSRSDAGEWQGTNTDAEGFLAPLRDAFGGSIPRGLGATLIGAGGAARAVAYALSSAGFRLLILNRTPERARELAEAFGARHGGPDALGLAGAKDFRDLVVQTTSAGMAPDVSDPAPSLGLEGVKHVYELVYAPPETPFARRARAAGCIVIEGRRMLVAQAMRQFLLFTGREYPKELVRELDRDF